MAKKTEEVQISKSEMIRKEFKQGKSISEIAKLHDLRYQFVYNIVSDYCLKNKIDMPRSRQDGETKAQKIIELFEAGKTTRQIMVELDTYPNYISRVISKYLASK